MKQNNQSLGTYIKNQQFEKLLTETIPKLNESTISELSKTSYDAPISQISEMLFYIPDYFYKKETDKNDNQIISTTACEYVYDFSKWLLDHEANPNDNIKYGVSCYLKSAGLKTPDLLKFLITNKSDIDLMQKDGQGKDAFVYAVINNSIENFEFLCEKIELDVNKKYVLLDGKTLLHLACASANEPMIDLLLSKGAKLSQRDHLDNLPHEMIPVQESHEVNPMALLDPEFSKKEEEKKMFFEKCDLLFEKLEYLLVKEKQEETNKSKVVYKTKF